MKKSIALILVCVMMLTAFVGCGEKDITGTISEPEVQNEPSAVTKPNSGTKSDVSESSAEPEAELELELGDISGGASYTNEFAGINFSLPTGWAFSTQEELMQLMSISTDELFSEDKTALLEYAMEGTVYDMMVSNASGENIMVMFENTARYLGGALLSEDGYLDALVRNFDLIEGMTYVVGDRGAVTLGGVEYKTLSATIEGYSISQQYAVHRVGKYMVCIAFTGFDDASITAMYDYFS